MAATLSEKLKFNEYGIHDFYFFKKSVSDDFTDLVVISPMWKADIFTHSKNCSIKWLKSNEIAKITYENCEFVYFFVSPGSLNVGDTILQIALTYPCKYAIFIGTVGSLDKDIDVNDFIVPEYSVEGKSFCNSLYSDLNELDQFLSPASLVRYKPDSNTNELTYSIAKQVCEKYNCKIHMSNVYSIQSLVSEYLHLSNIISNGYKSIEIETASFYAATGYCDIKASAVLQVSDNIILGKHLFNDINFKQYLRNQKFVCKIFPEIIKQIAMSLR